MSPAVGINVFQIMLALLFGGFTVFGIVGTYRGWWTRTAGVAWILVCGAGEVAVLWPAMTTRVARALGIGRGADLVLYCSVVTMVMGFLMVYARIRRLRREITLLVRELAIRDAEVGKALLESGGPDRTV